MTPHTGEVSTSHRDIKPLNDVEVYLDEAGEYRWRCRDGGNNRILAGSSEGYINKADCESCISQVFDQDYRIVYKTDDEA